MERNYTHFQNLARQIGACFSVLIQWMYLMPCFLQISFQKTKIPLTSSPWFFLPSPGLSHFFSFFPSRCSKTEQPGGSVINELHLWAAGGGWTTGAKKAKWNYHGEDFRSFVNLPFCFWRNRAGEKNSRTEYGHHPTRSGYRQNLKDGQNGQQQQAQQRQEHKEV